MLSITLAHNSKAPLIKIYQETFGKGKPIVLVHGWAMHSGIWRSFARALAVHFQVTCIDLPGHGRSEKLNPFTLEELSAALIKAVPSTPCCWLGWSLGATVVLDIAHRFPDRIKALVLLAGNPVFVQTASWPGMNNQLLDDFSGHLQANCQATLLRFLSLQVNGLENSRTLLKEIKHAVSECDAPDNDILQGGLAILKQADMRPALKDLKQPVSIILGARDTLVPATVGARIRQLNAACELTIIDKAGHVPFLSHQHELITLISRFMERA
jgi:pimeloyl-[acyl-carrier protein] methyl ester esterase